MERKLQTLSRELTHLTTFMLILESLLKKKFRKEKRHSLTIYITVLNPCTHDEVSKYISDICSVSKAAGPYSIPTSILKSNVDQLIYPITSILNKSLAEGTFHDLLKLASVCPIYKKHYRTKCANYRPISVLSNLSKIFERTMYNRIELFLSEFDTLYRLQFGFRKKHSTEHALLSIVEEIRKI